MLLSTSVVVVFASLGVRSGLDAKVRWIAHHYKNDNRYFNSPISGLHLEVIANDDIELYGDGKKYMSKRGRRFDEYQENVTIPDNVSVLAFQATNTDGGRAFVGIISTDIWTSGAKFGWKCTEKKIASSSWTEAHYNATYWPRAVARDGHPGHYKDFTKRLERLENGSYIWTMAGHVDINDVILCRGYLGKFLFSLECSIPV